MGPLLCKISGLWNDKIKGRQCSALLRFLTRLAHLYNIPLRLRKAGRVWCGGARETH